MFQVGARAREARRRRRRQRSVMRTRALPGAVPCNFRVDRGTRGRSRRAAQPNGPVHSRGGRRTAFAAAAGVHAGSSSRWRPSPLCLGLRSRRPPYACAQNAHRRNSRGRSAHHPGFWRGVRARAQARSANVLAAANAKAARFPGRHPGTARPRGCCARTAPASRRSRQRVLTSECSHSLPEPVRLFRLRVRQEHLAGVGTECCDWRRRVQCKVAGCPMARTATC